MLTDAVYLTTPDTPCAEAGVWDRAEIETFLKVQFQNGALTTEGVNGVTTLDVLKILIDRERLLNKPQMDPRRERSLAITKMEEALMWLERGIANAPREQRNG